MPNILGLNFGHDGAAALFKDNKIVAAIGLERLSRVKKDKGVSEDMISYLLEAGGLDLSAIDCIAFSAYYYHPDNQIRFYDLKGNELRQDLLHLTGGVSCYECRAKIRGRLIPAYFVQHHIAHCASSFYTSPFDKAACFSLDASGVHPEYCSLFAYGQGRELHYFYCPGLMLGNAYSVFTAKLGLGPGLTKAGTTMALASFGKKLPYTERWREFGQSWYEREFQQSDAVYVNWLWSIFSGLAPQDVFPKEESVSERTKDIAASLQYVFEEVLVDYAQKLYRESEHFSGGNLCLSGGSFLNSDANMQIKKRVPFKNIHLFPGCGDDGTAVGAALFIGHHLLGTPRAEYQAKDFMYLGKEYVIEEQGETYEVSEIAQALADGKVVAWFNGKSEFGPRALGNRSLLADPRSPKMKDHLNSEIKKREEFRPFAPSVLAEKAAEWFKIDFDSPLMLFISDVLKPDLIPAVCHIDNSARLQSVRREDNPRYYELISEFEKITGVPMLLNTSMNINNEPLVETPEDAMKFFLGSSVEILVLGDQVFRK